VKPSRTTTTSQQQSDDCQRSVSDFGAKDERADASCSVSRRRSSGGDVKVTLRQGGMSAVAIGFTLLNRAGMTMGFDDAPLWCSFFQICLEVTMLPLIFDK